MNRYITKEYILSFFVSFLFFFFIFFVNQILVFAQKIALKNVSVNDMLNLVVLYIPQFLMYTIPFSSLSSASMVIGNLSAHNEILAIRSCAISTKRIFLPIIFVSVLFSFSTYSVANYLIPSTAQRYREIYGEILEKIPTIELSSYSSTRFGNRVISNGVAKGNVIYNVLVFDDTDSRDSRVVYADRAEINLIDLERLVYSVELYNPKIVITDSASLQSYSVSTSEKMIMYLKLSATTEGYNPITPSQMSLKELDTNIEYYSIENNEIINQHITRLRKYSESLASMTEDLEEYSDVSLTDIDSTIRLIQQYEKESENDAFSFYYQYYKSEFHKKLALSAACTLLVLIAFPLSFVHMRYGRLTGLGLAVIVAVFYWFSLYFLHTQAIITSINPAILLWLPDFLIFFTGLFLLRRHAKQ